MATPTVLMRNQWANRIDTTPSSTATYSLMGTGFNTVDESLGPNVDQTQYVSDTAASNAITSYNASWSFEGDQITSEAAIAFFNTIATNQYTGEDAETTMIAYNVADIDPGDGTVDATRYPVIVAMESRATGAGGERLKFSGTLHQNGDATQGSYDTDTGVFTPSAS